MEINKEMTLIRTSEQFCKPNDETRTDLNTLKLRFKCYLNWVNYICIDVRLQPQQTAFFSHSSLSSYNHETARLIYRDVTRVWFKAKFIIIYMVTPRILPSAGDEDVSEDDEGCDLCCIMN